jgi:hypoxanthine phosphoribosyltransferase
MRKLVRGSPNDERYIYNWDQFRCDSSLLARAIQKNYGDFLKTCKGVFGVPRGGIPLAMELSKILNIPIVSRHTKAVELYMLVCDDIVDSGKVRSKFSDHVFVSIHMKPWTDEKPDLYVHMTDKWIVYPWEKEDD